MRPLALAAILAALGGCSSMSVSYAGKEFKASDHPGTHSANGTSKTAFHAEEHGEEGHAGEGHSEEGHGEAAHEEGGQELHAHGPEEEGSAMAGVASEALPPSAAPDGDKNGQAGIGRTPSVFPSTVPPTGKAPVKEPGTGS